MTHLKFYKEVYKIQFDLRKLLDANYFASIAPAICISEKKIGIEKMCADFSTNTHHIHNMVRI